MTKTIGVAAEDDLLLSLVAQAAEGLGATVIAAGPVRECHPVERV